MGWGVVIARTPLEAPRATFKYPTYIDAKEVFDALGDDSGVSMTVALTSPEGDVIHKKVFPANNVRF
jgi:hypothetical protein